MRNIVIILVLVFVLVLFIVPTWADIKLLQNVIIVKADSTEWLADHAANELVRYVAQMTGANVQIVNTTQAKTDKFLLGANLPEITSPDSKADLMYILALEEETNWFKSLPRPEQKDILHDGFRIQSKNDNKLTISAVKPIGLLYGVYEYLEKYCGCGFFWDGDYVPQRVHFPIVGIDDAQIPRWPVRHFGISSTWGLAKWHHQFRSLRQRKQILDWMVKRKLNWSYNFFGPTIGTSGVVCRDVFGIPDTEPDNFTFSGWPGCLDFPAHVRTNMIQADIDYGRQRGIKRIFYIPYGNVPHQFRQMHPDYNYVDHLGYSATVLYPDDPECTRWSQSFYQAIIETYGTDHVYCDTPFCESSGAAEAEESFKIKLAAAQRMCKTLKEIDEKAIWQSDSWDFGALGHIWTPDRIKRYFQNLPQEMMQIYDTAGLGNPFYKRTNYFEGTRWELGILHSFQGDDHLHGNLEHAIGVFQKLAEDPRATNCEGIYHVPECSGHNVLFFDLTTHLAWNPKGITLESFLNEYTQRRFGEKDFQKMRPAIELLVKSVYGGSPGGGDQIPIYKKLGCPYGPANWWPIIDDKVADHPAATGKGITELRQAIQQALSCRRTQQNNPLYVNDMVDWTRQYLANVFNWATIRAYQSFKKGDVDNMNSSIEKARNCLKHIGMILSTRADFSLQRQIDWAMQVPKSNPYLPWYMKQHCVNDLYSANEVYEQMHWFYTPRMEVYFNELQKRVSQEIKAITWGDIANRCSEFRNRWLNEDIIVPDEEKFPGTTMEAVVAVIENLEIDGK